VRAVESLALAQSRASGPLLAQYLIICPSCAEPAAAHVDEREFDPVLVRLVCPNGCDVDSSAVFARLARSHRMIA
jgi:hypothetical protein